MILTLKQASNFWFYYTYLYVNWMKNVLKSGVVLAHDSSETAETRNIYIRT